MVSNLCSPKKTNNQNPTAVSETNPIFDIFEAITKLKVLIIGDVMTDHYIFGHVNRISPEGPIPIVEVYKRENRLGGAANVAMNVHELGAKAVLVSVVGDDHDGHQFKAHLQGVGIDARNVILDQERRTTVKTRIISRNQQMLRYDYEQSHPIDEKTELLLIDNAMDVIFSEKPHVVILQDYNKGILTKKVIANIIHSCKQTGIPVAVDPKKDNFLEYKGCTLFKPNLREAAEGLNMKLKPTNESGLANADAQLRAILKHEMTVITLSDKGIFVGTEDDHEVIPAFYRNITDVSGAGDTVLAMLGLGLAMGLDVFATAELANIAGGMVCEEVGVTPVNREKLLKEAVRIMGG